MRSPETTIALFAAACLGASMVHGATHGTTLREVLRETWRGFVRLAGGIALLCLAIWLVTQAAQG
ncbi:MAG: hypothetical protein HMLKMBBP_03419 [Planctomycetes bacterium]|nr:hypothetical protein [Planctomycetota bacterium]